MLKKVFKKEQKLQVKVLEFEKKAKNITRILTKNKHDITVFEKIELASIIEDV
jgi:hypothetical protein